MGVELELKYKADEAALQSINAAFPEPGVILQMETVYYDTPDGALSARHYTLRKRLENGVSVCTLKTPAKQGRNEWETECDNIQDAVPVLCKLGGPEELSSLTQAGLAPVCGAKFTRIAKTVELQDGTAELALDKGVLMGGGKEIPLCEVEIERKTCSEETCVAYATLIARRYALEQEPDSKFRRAQMLAKGE